MTRDLTLSVLDLSPIAAGSTPGRALRNSIDLARHVEAWGYHRHWVAEHHSMPGIASAAPAVLIAHLADATTTLRVGSGGVMLPNHAPLAIAEQFGTLEALHPGRIDLGLGRAPGTDPLATHALRRGRREVDPDEFPQLLGELLAYFEGSFPDDHPYRRIRPTPALGLMPAIWLLGSSDFSARLAGALGLPFAFAHHFSAGGTLAAVDAYRRSFRPSEILSEPHLALGANVIVADDDATARRLSKPGLLSIVRLRSGYPGTLPDPEEAEAYRFTPAERAIADSFGRSQIAGSPETVRAGIDELVAATGADELIVTTNVFHHEDRLRSYDLLGELAGLDRRGERSPSSGPSAPKPMATTAASPAAQPSA